MHQYSRAARASLSLGSGEQGAPRLGTRRYREQPRRRPGWLFELFRVLLDTILFGPSLGSERVPSHSGG